MIVYTEDAAIEAIEEVKALADKIGAVCHDAEATVMLSALSLLIAHCIVQRPDATDVETLSDAIDTGVHITKLTMSLIRDPSQF